jgi:hypothetical protein
MKPTARLFGLGWVAVASLICWFSLTRPASAQQGADAQQAPAYARLETQSTTYPWLAAAAMMVGTMIIAFRKPKRVSHH